MSTTKITTASVRVMLSHNYSNFEISAQLENENGIEIADIDKARQQCQQLATDAVAEYKKAPNSNPKEEIKRIEKKIEEIKNDISEKKDGTITDQKEIAKVEKLPLYSDTKKAKK
jgi:homoserine kinase